MNLIASAKGYLGNIQRDVSGMIGTVRGPAARTGGLLGISSAYGMLMLQANTIVALAASTELFQTLSRAVDTLYNDAQSIVTTVATMALVICILGIFICSMFGPKATATMTSALKMVICFFIFWQLTPVILRTLTNLFGAAGGGTTT